MSCLLNPYRYGVGTPVPSFANVKLLVHGGGANGTNSFTDNSSYANALTANGNVQYTSGTTIGSENAILFDGTGDFITTPVTNLQAQNQDFCIEAYIILDALGKGHGIFYNQQNSGGNGGYKLDIGGGNQVVVAVYNNAGIVGSATGATALSSGTLYHVAGSREGNNLRVFVNGVLDGTGTQSGTNSNQTNNSCRIGDDAKTAGNQLQGKMNWLRVTIGQALYTSSFTAPSMPFPTS